MSEFVSDSLLKIMLTGRKSITGQEDEEDFADAAQRRGSGGDPGPGPNGGPGGGKQGAVSANFLLHGANSDERRLSCVAQEANNALCCPSREKFRTTILKGARQ